LSREVNFNDPDSWTDEDREYLRQRVDLVPEQHRASLITPVLPPAQAAESTEIARLRAFLERNYPDEMNVEGDTPVGVAIRLLSDDDEVVEEETGDDYDSWNVAELRAEVASRRTANADAGLPGDESKLKKADAIAALRDYDGKYPA
jgi:hypothetical protein